MEDLNETRNCFKCNLNKPITQFRKYTNTLNSYSWTCKKCSNEKDKLRKKNIRRKKIENYIVKCEICNEEKPLITFAKLKKFYKKKICNSCYPSFLTKQKNEWCKNESITNINYRLKKSLASRLRNVLKNLKLEKNNSTINYIGCNIQYLKEWFEYNFSEEMNWDNYGSYWSIDHVLPVCIFDLTNEDEKMKCWSWSNLTPVTIKYNSSKKSIDTEQVNNIIKKIELFKEEGSTTKWFSGDFILSSKIVDEKNNKLTLN